MNCRAIRPITMPVRATGSFFARAGGNWVRVLATVVLLVAGMGTNRVAKAQEATLAPPPAMTERDLAALFDGILPAQLARNDIAGAVVSVVKDGRVVFAKGYGHADVAGRKPVSADTTLFRIGSVSKLFTWTAVMQLVEQGKIDLDTDINRYLDFRLADAFGKPVTMRHLMTHTAGFEDTFRDVWSPHAGSAGQLRAYVTTRQPARIFAPGTIGAYSNYGATLAGYIVQRVSGEQFEAYIERHITRPLGMSRTSFAQPLPVSLAPFMSAGYRHASGGAKPFELVQAPAGAASTTARDMARFMTMYLQAGSLDGVQVLKPETTAMMHAAQHGFDRRDNATGLGWLAMRINGQRLIGHGGETLFFHSLVELIPDANVGVFVSYNSSGNGAVGTLGPVLRAFMERYFPYKMPPLQAMAGATANGASIAGVYMPSRRGQSNMAYLMALLAQTEVRANADGTIAVANAVNATGQLRTWRETAPGYWQDISGRQGHLIFKQDAGGRWQFSDGDPANVYQGVAWHQHKFLVVLPLAFCIVTCALSLLLWPAAAWLRRRAGIAGDALERRNRNSVRLAAAINLLLWGAFAATIAFAATTLEFVTGTVFDSLLRIMHIVVWLAFLGIAALMWTSRHSRPAKGRWPAIHRALVWLASLASAWVAWNANLLAWSVRY